MIVRGPSSIKGSLDKLVERTHYVRLLVSLGLGYFVIAILRVVAPLLPRTGRKDLALYVHAPLGSAGYTRRFEVFFPLLERDGVRYDAMVHFPEDYVIGIFEGPRKGQYALFSRILWKRIAQVLQARHYKAVFIQRSLFPLYPDAGTPHLERLARALSDNITLDLWDPVHLWQPELTFASLRYADKLCVVNEALFEYYAPLHPRVYVLPIAVDLSLYVRKTDYALGHPIVLLYTGSRGNVQANLEPLLPVLAELARELDLELLVVGPYAPSHGGLRVRHVPWNSATYFRLLAEADLALFPYFGRPEHNRWRVASKTIDYLATGLPFVGVTEGLPAGVDADVHLFPVRDAAEWPVRIREALSDEERRTAVGRRGREFVEETFPLSRTYEEFKRIALEPRPRAVPRASAPARGA